MHKKAPIERAEFEKLLQNAIAFNINYVIKPRATLLKFLFGSTDARPTEYIIERLGYFQFYRYYTDAIIEFIQLHSPPVISISQVEKLINEINRKILTEISDEEGSDTQRLNLIKLLYHFFIDLSENNPINLRLPRGILSAFLQDKQFYEIKKSADKFFKEDIFIQEAVDLMRRKPEKIDAEEERADDKEESKKIEETLKNLNSGILDTEVITREIGKTKSGEEKPEEMQADIVTDSNVESLEDRSSIPSENMPESEAGILDRDLYSEELLAISAADESRAGEMTPEDWKKKIREGLFCEVNYRKKIIKKIFRRDENLFNELVSGLLDITSWDTAAEFIDNYFTKNKIDYYSEEAVKFVDIMHEYFEKDGEHDENRMNSGYV